MFFIVKMKSLTECWFHLVSVQVYESLSFYTCLVFLQFSDKQIFKSLFWIWYDPIQPQEIQKTLVTSVLQKLTILMILDALRVCDSDSITHTFHCLFISDDTFS